MNISKKRIFDYLKYAIGEIILLTIGILLAVTINNWNSEKKTKKLEEELLTEMIEELQFNIDRINFLDTVSSATLDPIKFVDSIFQMKVSLLEDGLNIEEIPQLFLGPMSRFNSFNLNSEVFEQLKESGILNKLDKDLKLSIKQYYKLIEREERYNETTLPTIKKAVDDCKYGYQELRTDYFKDSTSYLEKHDWIFDESSKNYIDMKQHINIVAKEINTSRTRMIRIIAESEKLKLLLINRTRSDIL